MFNLTSLSGNVSSFLYSLRQVIEAYFFKLMLILFRLITCYFSKMFLFVGTFLGDIYFSHVSILFTEFAIIKSHNENENNEITLIYLSYNIYNF